MKQRIQVARIDHGNRFFFCAHSFIHKIAGDFQGRLCSAFSVAALKHIQFTVFNSKLHILHVTVMLFKQIAYFFKFSICLRELFLHLGDRHGGTYARNHIFTLGVDKEFAHQLVLTGGGIPGKSNACTGIVIQVAENHGHNIDCCTPAVRDIIIPAVNIGARIIPGTEDRFYRAHQLLFGIGGEI